MALIEWNQLSADLKTYGLLTGSLNISGSVNLDGDLLPAVAEIHDIGSTSLPFRDLYLTTGSLKFVKGGVVQATVSAVKEGIQVGNIKITTGSIDIVNNAGTTISTVAQASSSAGDVTGTEVDPIVFSPTGSFVATSNDVQISGSTIVTQLTASGVQVNGTLTANDDLIVGEYISHKGDANTRFNFTDDRVQLEAGGINFFGAHKKDSAPHLFTINNGGNHIDFQIKDNDGDTLFKTDADSDNVLFPDAVKISGSAASTGSFGELIVDSNITAGGNLTIQGTTTTIDTTNLTIKDKFAVFASGSTSAVDGGIIISKQADGAGFALGYDSGTSRWGLDNDLAIGATDISPDSYLGLVTYSTSAPSTAPTYGGASTGYGAIHVKSDTGDIYIYS